MINKSLIALLFAVFVLGFHSRAFSEQIIVPVGSQGASKAAMERPRNGINKDAVAAKFGEPTAKKSAVGDPPISSWEYDQYIVFFEYDRVLHSVLKPDQTQDLK